MTFNLNVNQIKAKEWDLSLRTSLAMCKFVDLSSWAQALHVDGKTYYIFYRSKLLEEVPLVGTSLPTASKIIKELEEKEIIESTHKATTPAYRLTDKGREWISDTPYSKPNDGEISNDGEKEQFTFRLKRELEYDDLTDEYKKYLKTGSLKYAKEQDLAASEYDDFINFKKSDGVSHKNWASAFKRWCSNARKYGRAGKGDKKSTSSSGNYSLAEMDL